MFWSRNRNHVDPHVAETFGNGLDAEELSVLAQLSTPVDITVGTVLTSQGDIGREALIVVEGTAIVERDGEVIGDVSPGEIIGEAALLSGERRNATVIAATKMKVYALAQWEFTVLLDRCPGIAKRITTTAVRRLAEV